MSRTIVPIGGRAGGLTEQAAGWTGLRPGTAVAVANVDAHVSVPAATVTAPGTLVAIMGTSICHVVLADDGAGDRRDVRRRRRRRDPRVSSATRRARRPSATCSRGSSTKPCRRAYHDLARSRGRQRPRGPGRGGGGAPPGRVGAARARLVERQPVGAGRCRPVGRPGRDDAGHDRARDLSRPDRGDRVRDAGDHRCLRGRRGRRSTRSSPAAGSRIATRC